jgi:PucR C-terminal helix-turn-helix domain/GGDEF-like domain
MQSDSTSAARRRLYDRLDARRREIEEAVLTRILAVSDPTEPIDPEYAEGLRAAVSTAIEYGLATIELGEERSPSPPPALIAQARLAARSGIALETVLRRYIAGHSLLADYLVEEAEREGPLCESRLQRLLGGQAAVLDRLVAAVSEEHAREWERPPLSFERRQVELIGRLLAGEGPESAKLDYDLEGHHVGLLLSGQGAMEVAQSLAASLRRRLLAVPQGEGQLWAWLGGTEPGDPSEVASAFLACEPAGLSLAIGEPGCGLRGWRLTHRQAKAALPIAVRGPERFARYAEVMLLSSVFGDALLRTFLRRHYLEPLEAERDAGEAARQTLSAYFAAKCSVSLAAAALGVSRQAMAKRLYRIEERVGRSLATFGVEFDLALHMESLEAAADQVATV